MRAFFRPKFPTHYNTLHHVGITRRYHYSIYHKPFDTCSLDACRTTSHHNNLPRAEVSHTSLITAFAFTQPTFVLYESRNLFPRRVPHRVVLCQRSYVCCFIHFILQYSDNKNNTNPFEIKHLRKTFSLIY